jgi:hypothetical protein
MEDSLLTGMMGATHLPRRWRYLLVHLCCVVAAAAGAAGASAFVTFACGAVSCVLPPSGPPALPPRCWALLSWKDVAIGRFLVRSQSTTQGRQELERILTPLNT